MNPEYTIRPAEVRDAEIIASHRAGMFLDMGRMAKTEMPSLIAASTLYYKKAIPKKEYYGWVVEHENMIVAGGGLVLRKAPPFPGHLNVTDSAYIFNMYTERAHRRKGLARKLMNTMLDWCRERKVSSIALHASDDGRVLYEDLGFEPTNEMRLKG